MNKVIISIDPGVNGFICARIIEEQGERYNFYSIKERGLFGIPDFIKENNIEGYSVCAIIEEVHAIYGSAASSTFKFGETFGFLQGVIVSNKIKLHMVAPQKWQLLIWENKDKEYVVKGLKKNGEPKKVIDTKKTSYNAAQRMFPNIDFKRSERCKAFDDNKVDSVLINEYARIKNLI